MITCEFGHFQNADTAVGSLSGDNLSTPCGTVIPRGDGLSSIVGVADGRGIASAKVNGKVPGCHDSGRE